LRSRDSAGRLVGLDFFGARYFSGAQGRFTSPDPLFFQAEMLTDPQRFNLYAYGRNNPLQFVDPTGKEIELIGDGEQRKKALALLQKGVGAAGSQLAVREKKGFLGLGKTHYMVEINGDATKFASANAASGDLAKIVQHRDTVQVGFARGDETLNAVSGKTTLNQESYNGITGFFDGIVGSLGSDLRSYIRAPDEDYGAIPGYKMENGKPAEANPLFTLFHELGHAWGVMQGHSNPQILQDALNLESKVRKVQDPKAASRTVH
jgi:RHS repeat-associated protein